MNADTAIETMAALLRVALTTSLPVLLACLVSGVVVGVVQTATQINEPSVGYLVKLVGVVGVLLATASPLAAHLVGYTRGCLEAVAHVVR